MKRLQISLEPELDEQLGLHARREGISKAEVVRRSLKADLEPTPSLAGDSLLDLVGIGTGGGLKPGESINEIVYGKKAERDDLR